MVKNGIWADWKVSGRNYLKMEWLDDMSVKDSSFIVEDFYITDSVGHWTGLVAVGP